MTKVCMEWLMFGKLAFEESWWKKVWQIYCASNTEQYKGN